MQIMIKEYREETGNAAVDMKEVAKFAVRKGWKLPSPKDPLDRLAADFSKAARDEIRHDEITGKPYRVNHAVPVKYGCESGNLWVDIDEAPRPAIFKSLMNRREQMVGDGLQLTFDADHWNNIHPKEEPIQIPMDFTYDVEERKNAPDEYKKTG